jgi:hypothetical protein
VKKSAPLGLVEAQTPAIKCGLAFADGGIVDTLNFYGFFNFPHPRRTHPTASRQAIVI